MQTPVTARRAVPAALVSLALTCCARAAPSDAPAGGSEGHVAAVEAAAHHREVVQPEGLARLPVFSSAIRNGDLLWISGQIGTRPGVTPPTLVDGGVEAETRQVFANIQAVLSSAGLDLGDLVKCTVFLADIADYASVNAVYAGVFEGMDPPARSALAGSGLALGARVEIECIAAYPPGR